MKNKIYEMLRKYVAWVATQKLGKVEITDKEIICYVDKRKIKKKEKYIHRYNLMFFNIQSKDELYRIYKVDKPVHYIVKDVNFDIGVNIQTDMKNCHVTFENCTFTSSIYTSFGDHITFRNNTYKARNYKDYFSLVPEGEFYISTKRNKNEINKLEFIYDTIDVTDIKGISIINMNDINTVHPNKKSKLWLYAKDVILNHSDIVDAESIEIEADTLQLENDWLISKEIEIKANKVILDNAKIKADVIAIESPKIEGKLPIYHEGLFINGVEVDKNEAIIDNYDLELQQKRLELVNSLKKIERTAEETISEEIKKQPLRRVLKK